MIWFAGIHIRGKVLIIFRIRLDFSGKHDTLLKSEIIAG